MDPNTYIVTVETGEDGPDPAMLDRFATIAAYRLRSLDKREGHYPEAGGAFDMLDNLEGKFLWEMSDEEIAQFPPSRVDFEVVSVDPAERPAAPGEIRVVVRLPY